MNYTRKKNFFYKQLDAHSRWILIQSPSVGGWLPYKTKRANRKWIDKYLPVTLTGKDALNLLLQHGITTLN